MKACVVFFLIVAGGYLAVRLVLYGARFIKKDLARNRREMFDSFRRGGDVYAHFTYTPEEWKTAFAEVFVEDGRGTKMLEPHGAVAQYFDEKSEPSTGEVFFARGKIYLTDALNHKIYIVNTPNNSIALLEVGVLNTTPLKILRLRVHVPVLDDDSTEEIFHVPLPSAADAKKQDLVSFYRSVIEERGRVQRGE